jgi:hypothetical protein
LFNLNSHIKYLREQVPFLLSNYWILLKKGDLFTLKRTSTLLYLGIFPEHMWPYKKLHVKAVKDPQNSLKIASIVWNPIYPGIFKMCSCSSSSCLPSSYFPNSPFQEILIFKEPLTFLTIITTYKGLQITKGLLNWVEIGRVRRKEAYPNISTFTSIDDYLLTGMVNWRVIYYNNWSGA